jgi:NADPH2:quinone reductase
VTDVAVGDRVAWHDAPGSYAERVVVPAAMTVPVPDGTDLIDAAAVMLQGMTAHYLCRSTFVVTDGAVAVVHAAAGGVGLLLTQMIKTLGGTVIATTSSTPKAALAQQAGADHVVGYDEFGATVDRVTDGRGADVVYDSVGGEAYARSTKCVAFEGRILVVGFASGQIPSVALNHALIKNYSIVGLHWGLYQTKEPQAIGECHRQLTKLVADGAIRPLVSERLGLDDVPEALDKLAHGDTVGRIVFTP